MCSNQVIWEVSGLQDNLQFPSSPSNIQNCTLRQSVHESLCAFCQIDKGMNTHHWGGLSRGKGGGFLPSEQASSSSEMWGCLGHALPHLQAVLGVPSYCFHCSSSLVVVVDTAIRGTSKMLPLLLLLHYSSHRDSQNAASYKWRRQSNKSELKWFGGGG